MVEVDARNAATAQARIVFGVMSNGASRVVDYVYALTRTNPQHSVLACGKRRYGGGGKQRSRCHGAYLQRLGIEHAQTGIIACYIILAAILIDVGYDVGAAQGA